MHTKRALLEEGRRTGLRVTEKELQDEARALASVSRAPESASPSLIDCGGRHWTGELLWLIGPLVVALLERPAQSATPNS